MNSVSKLPRWGAAIAVAASCLTGLTEASAQTLLLRYTFDESTNGTEDAVDSGAAPAANGVFQGGALRTSDTPGGASKGALDTSAANTYVDGGDAAKLDGLGALTLTAWVKLVGNPVNGNRVMAKQVGTGNFDGFSFAFNNPTSGTIAANNVRLNLALGGVNGFGFNVSGEDFSADNEWTFVAATYDGIGNVLFYTGKENASVTQLGVTQTTGVATPGQLVAHDLPFRVAASSSGTSSAPVLIDDVRVYSGVLSQSALDLVRLENLQGNDPSAVLITEVNRSGNTVTFEFESENGVTHKVEYKNSLDDATWTELTTISGDGTTKQVTDDNATPSTRFYRIVSQ